MSESATATSVAVAFVFRSPWVWIAMPGPFVAWALAAGGAWAAFAAYHAWCLLGLACLGGRGGLCGRFLNPFWVPMVIGILLSAVAWGLAGTGFPAGLGEGSLADAFGRLGVSKTSLWWLFPYFCVVNPLVEEWFWRGAVSGWFRDVWRGRGVGARIASLCFAVWHAVPVSVLFPGWVVGVSVLVIAGGGYAAECLRRRGASLVELALWHGFAVDLPVAVWMARALVS